MEENAPNGLRYTIWPTNVGKSNDLNDLITILIILIIIMDINICIILITVSTYYMRSIHLSTVGADPKLLSGIQDKLLMQVSHSKK